MLREVLPGVRYRRSPVRPDLLRWPGRPILLLGVAGNLAVVILWLVTRTAGIPLFGPHTGEVEAAYALDLTCTLRRLAS